jgi:hypothetical protein
MQLKPLATYIGLPVEEHVVLQVDNHPAVGDLTLPLVYLELKEGFSEENTFKAEVGIS